VSGDVAVLSGATMADGVSRAFGSSRRSRSAFPTTEALENAMASPTISGFRRPAAASGSAAAL
jgi:hypothetical protein